MLHRLPRCQPILLLTLAPVLACGSGEGDRPRSEQPSHASPAVSEDQESVPAKGGAAVELWRETLAGGAERAEDPAATGTDPAGWPDLSEHEGVPVEVRREYGGRGGALSRIRCVTREGGIDHGPEWLFHDALGIVQVKQCFALGVLDGPYADWFPTGIPRSEGIYRQGKMHGTWKRWDEQGTLIGVREYQDGEPHGAFQTWYRSGEEKSFTEYAAGRRNGVEWEKSRQGVVVLECHWVDGERHGPYREHHQDTGLPKVEGTYELGERTGLWIRYDEAARKRAEESHTADRLDGPCRTWYPSGALESETEYSEGVEEGLQVGYYEDGSRQREGRVSGGQRTGRWTFWRPDGSVDTDYSGVYEDGALVERAGD